MQEVYFRFQRLNQDTSLLDYLMFFLAGALGGSILIAFLRRSKTKAARTLVLAAFILATPIALTGMIVGGLAGPRGGLVHERHILGVYYRDGLLGRTFSIKKCMI